MTYRGTVACCCPFSADVRSADDVVAFEGQGQLGVSGDLQHLTCTRTKVAQTSLLHCIAVKFVTGTAALELHKKNSSAKIEPFRIPPGRPSRHHRNAGNHQGEAYSGGDGYSTPLFGFGEGLSYTNFTLTALDVHPKAAGDTGVFTLTVNANNVGTRAGACVVQVYMRDPVALPVRISSVQLVRFQRVMLGAHESRTIQIKLTAHDLVSVRTGWLCFCRACACTIR